MASVTGVSGIRAVLMIDPGAFGIHDNELGVVSFRYEEELGQPFSIEIELECQSPSSKDLETLIPNKVIGRPLVVKIKRDNAVVRQFHAIIETFEAIDNDGHFNRYRGTAVPWYSLLKLAENSEIYPNTNARALVTLIHKRFQFGQDLTFHHQDEDSNSANWVVRTQYRETYFQFLQRSLQQEGIYYYWTHTSNGHVMNTTDGTASAPSFGTYASIPYNPSSGVTTESIYEWSHKAAVQPQQAVLNDYNCLDSQPAAGSSLLVSKNSSYRRNDLGFHEDTPYDKLAVFRHPGMYSTRGADSSVAGSGRWYAQRLVQAFECRQAFIRGKARCVGLAAGHTFKVSWGDYWKNQYYFYPPYSRANGEYLTTKITLEIHPGHPTKPFVDCTFEAIPVRDPIKYRPANTAQTPRIHGVQSAIVCKAATGDKPPEPRTPVPDTRDDDSWQQDTTPHCEFPQKAIVQVQVKFHWCRGNNERTDWIRLTHLMAGNGWGEFHLPRPGDEVLVAFEHGDPDRPVIVGCLYNDKHKLFFDLNPKTTHGPKLQKVFAIKDPGGNLFIMDPGDGKSPSTKQLNKDQTITLYSEGATEPSSVQIGKNEDETPGLPGKGSQ